MNDIAALLKTFSDAHGLSGYEDDVAELLRRELEPLVDEGSIDRMGNVIGVRAGEGPTVMIAAHMDEIGAMVSHVDDDGYLKMVPVGGWSDQTILGQRVMVHTSDGRLLPGVVGSRPPHMMDAEERKRLIKTKEMFVDCGATSAVRCPSSIANPGGSESETSGISTACAPRFSTTTASECGSSSRTPSSAASRTSSATITVSGSSVSSPSR